MNRPLIKFSQWLYKKAGGNGLPGLLEMPVQIKEYQSPPPVKMRVREQHQCELCIPEKYIKQRMAAKLAADLVKTQLVTFDAEITNTSIGNAVIYTLDILVVPPKEKA